MTDAETLTLTGGQWRCLCWQSGNHRDAKVETFVRADSRDQAERIAMAVTGRRFASAYVYRPWEDPRLAGIVREVPHA